MMKISILFLVVFSCTTFGMAQQAQPGNDAKMLHLMPVPASIQVQAGRLALQNSFSIAVKGYTDVRLQGAVDRTVSRMQARTGLDAQHRPDAAAATIVVECQGAGKAIPSLGEDESYSIDVSDTQAI